MEPLGKALGTLSMAGFAQGKALEKGGWQGRGSLIPASRIGHGKGKSNRNHSPWS